ncbi:uncharacterized protein SPSK_04428 [Sporothrix schenckii 1099-18]|uniref:Uncharacterized protein n=1 Tax=Sporothrix schenckii 1099-18 TaxID=1397361 RepID=A0A0F2M2S5_SPOSC|nr:uncharacterized protein SPSK_04428 [Sporothrix schenckii 1099-18]KJR83055.1 hypothetical protein SPSK_04428 [Sporothrix schenckii 1099-18]
MSPGSPSLAPHHSPTRKSSDELSLFPVPTRSNDGPPLRSHRKQNSGTNEFHGTSLMAIPEPEPAHETADFTASFIADEMDVDSGTTPVNEAAAAQQQQQQQQQPALEAPQPTQTSQLRAVRSPVRTPELQTTLPQRQAPNGTAQSYQQPTQPTQPPQPPQLPQPKQTQRGASQARESSPGTPGHIPPFDWEEFEARYEHALAEMNGEEKELLEEFDRLVNYFNVWASAATAHDDERAVKRLQTRERYVKIAEQSLGQRKQHLTEVVRAFQSALALLSQT